MTADLAAAVDLFDRSPRRVADADLDRPWAWNPYGSGGQLVRLAGAAA